MIDLKLDHVSKKYKLPANANQSKRWYRAPFRRSPAEMWALRDVNFEVNEGEALGIIGHNGAGKTTLLKLLSSITTPTQGQISIRGRLVALVEVSSGFHPELTGRENIYLHGPMLGMRRSEIARKLDSIIDFSGVEKYIDVPVKRYSTGMYVRLGFSIAAHLEPDIILLDEVLAVGDVAFQAKCLERIEELRKSGRTIVFVSHDLAAVDRLCHRALLLERGRIVLDGAPRAVIDQYQQMAFADQETNIECEPDQEKPARCIGVTFSPAASEERIRTGYPMAARLRYRASERIHHAVFRISFYWPSGYLCAQLTNDSFGQPGLTIEPGEGTIDFLCPALPVVPGLYRADVGIEVNGRTIDLRQRSATLSVAPGKTAVGDFYIESSCTISSPQVSSSIFS
ncbi:MAG TPA: polysaccharide ABC transporter ATP-binding protein [Candidatus Aquilonibacter sp.]|nr:polysaccharide ABC transporter ATP-binding protein [Candidatus Aquilonibacter sp.]